MVVPRSSTMPWHGVVRPRGSLLVLLRGEIRTQHCVAHGVVARSCVLVSSLIFVPHHVVPWRT